VITALLRLCDDDDWCPCPPEPPNARQRIVEAVVVAGLSAILTGAIEWVYAEIKERRRRSE